MMEKEIDDFKNELSKNKEQLTTDEINERMEKFIGMVKQYKVEHPTHTRCVQRWRNWYITVKDNITQKSIPTEEYGVLQYHLESFRVMNADIAAQRLLNWINRMVRNNYYIDEKTRKMIDDFIAVYKYKVNW